MRKKETVTQIEASEVFEFCVLSFPFTEVHFSLQGSSFDSQLRFKKGDKNLAGIVGSNREGGQKVIFSFFLRVLFVGFFGK